MKIDIITIFPNFFNEFLSTSIIKRAINQELVTINIHDLRDYALNKHKTIDDTPYGGGVGMLMSFPPFYECLKKLKTTESLVVMLSPQGQVWNQSLATQTALTKKHLILLCGHYEGIDARVLKFVDLELSIGDYVLTGGELAAMVIADSITRLVPNVINEASYLEDSHQNGLLKYPQYTKPEEYQGFKVPDVLLSGHHKNINEFRLYESLKATYQKRPDLLTNAKLTEAEEKVLAKVISDVRQK
jgi:tRNA (guanine37-N1)-methyltransferase